MKVKYKKQRTIITLDHKEERKAVFKALRFYEIKKDHKDVIISILLNVWMREAGTLK